MFNFPKTTEFNKRIPKPEFYENLSVSPTIKRVFVDQIRLIYWRNKLAQETLNVAAGETVSEIEVFELKLAVPDLDVSVLKLIDKEIPYHLLFLLEYEGKYQACIGYKEASSGTAAFKVGSYYHTDWLTEDELPLKVEGLSLDAVYENFVRQIAGDELHTGQEESLKESVERAAARKKLEKEIAALQAQIRKEKQFKRQMEVNSELRKLKRKMESLHDC